MLRNNVQSVFDRSDCFVFQDAFDDKFEMLVLHQIILQFEIILMLAIYSLHYVVLKTILKIMSILIKITFV